MAMNTPARNCFQNHCPDLGSSKKNTRLLSWLPIASASSPGPRPRSRAMNTMQSTTEPIRHALLRRSVHIRAFTPPLTVYSHMSPMVAATLISNGMPRGRKIRSCSTAQTTKNLTEAPKIFDTKNIQAPLR